MSKNLEKIKQLITECTNNFGVGGVSEIYKSEVESLEDFVDEYERMKKALDELRRMGIINKRSLLMGDLERFAARVEMTAIEGLFDLEELERIETDQWE